MGKPTIVAVDDDPQVLAAVRGDLRSQYGKDHRIVAAGSGAEGLEAVEQLHRRGDEVALFVVDQRMPEMEGTEFLLAASRHFPAAKRVLLTAYADTEAAIRSINDVGLDHYLLKPWAPPEQNLYPVLDDLLDDWHAAHQPVFDGVRVIGARWSADTHEVKEFLARNQIPYRFLDVDRDPEAATLLDTRSDEESGLPLVLLADGQALTRPDTPGLAKALGLHVVADAPFYDVLVIGAGPAGLAAGVYGASEGLHVAVLERQATGGQAGTSSRIENYLGFPKGISGADLARRATAQAQRLGAEILTPVDVVGVRVEGPSRFVQLSDGRELGARALVVASGMKVRRLDVPGYERLTGAGVFYGATAHEGQNYVDENVVVVGGANSAGQAAMMFSQYCKQVTMLVRGPDLESGMSQYLIEQIAGTPNIEVRLNTQVVEVHGDTHLERLDVVDSSTDAKETLDASGLFIYVGAVPHTSFLDGVVQLNDRGFVPTGPDITGDGSRPRGWPLDRDPYLLETSVPGIFAAGDVRDGVVRRVASAVGQGSICISFVHQYLASA